MSTLKSSYILHVIGPSAALCLLLSSCGFVIGEVENLGGGATLTAPTLGSLGDSNTQNYINTTVYAVSLTSTSTGVTYTIGLYSGMNCAGAPLTTTIQALPTYTAAALVNGSTYSIKVVAANSAGSSSPVCSPGITVDTQNPNNVTYISPAGNITLGATTYDVIWSDTDVGVSGLATSNTYYTELFSNGTCTGVPASTGYQTSTTLSLSGLLNGSVYSVRLTSYDKAGNHSVATCSSSITINTAVPVLALSHATANAGYAKSTAAIATITNDPSAVKWCLSETQTTAPASGLAACAGGAWVGVRPTTFTLSAGDGTKTVYLWVADIGDVVITTAVTASIVLDTLKPTSTCTGIAANYNSTSATATPGCADVTSGCLGTECSLDGAAYGASCTFAGLTEAAHTIDVRSTDNAGNVQTAGFGQCAFTVDVTAPTATIAAGQPTDPTATTPLNITIGGAGVTAYQYKVGIGTDCSVAGGYSADVLVATHITDADAVNGIYVLCVIGKDAAGNYQAIASATTISWTKVANMPPAITTPANAVYPLDGVNEPIVAQTIKTLTSTAIDPEGNNPVTWSSCTYQTLGLHASDPNYAAAGTNCTTLASYTTTNGVLLSGGTASFAAGVITWNPTTNQRGTYKFTVTAADSLANSASSSFYVTVRDNFTSSKLLYGLDSLFSLDTTGLTGIASIPRLDTTGNDTTASWLNFANGAANATISTVAAAPWSGNGTSSSSYQLNLNGTSDYFTLGTPLNGMTKLRFTAFVKPTSITTANSVLLTTSSGTDGFTVKQGWNTIESGRLVLMSGSTVSTYRDVILSDSPIGYYPLDEIAATPPDGTKRIMDYSGGNYCSGGPCNLIFNTWASTSPEGNVMLGRASRSTRFGTAARFNGNSTIGDMGDSNFYFNNNAGTDSAFSLEAWFKEDPGSAGNSAILCTNPSKGGYCLYLDGNEKMHFEVGGDNGKVIGRLYNTAISLLTWHHVVVTYSGSKLSSGIKIYIDGVQRDDTDDENVTYNGVRAPTALNIGDNGAGSGSEFAGSIDEVAVYSSVLSAARVLAHYQAADGSYVVSEPLTNSTWNYISGAYDGTNFSLSLNGASDGSFTPAAYNPGPNSTATVGRSQAGANYFSGSIGGLRLYGTSDGTSPGTTATSITEFTATGNKYRSMPVEQIYSSNLILHLDAATAAGGIAPYAAGTGCTSNSSWSPLVGTFPVNLSFFATCATYGWQGAGTAANPYVLYFDYAVRDTLRLDEHGSALSFGNAGTDSPFSVEIWYYPVATNGQDIELFDKSDYYFEYGLWHQVTDGKLQFRLQNVSDYIGVIGNTVIPMGAWHHIVTTYDGSKTTAGMKMYIDGTEETYTTNNNGAYNGMDGSASTSFVINDDLSSPSQNSRWKLAIMRIYSTALTQTQIRQNCHAQKARFAGASCAGP